MIKLLTLASILVICFNLFAGCSIPVSSRPTIILPKSFIGEVFIVIDKESKSSPRNPSEIRIPKNGVLYVKESPFKGDVIMVNSLTFVRGKGASKEVLTTYYRSKRKPLSNYSKEELETVRVIDFGSVSSQQFETKSGKVVKLDEGYYFFAVDSLKNMAKYDFNIEDKYH